jgi:hypothetical protein
VASFNKFNNWVHYLAGGVAGQAVSCASDTFNIMLTNTAPLATNTKYADISATEVANGNGYTTGGTAVGSTSISNSSGTEIFIGNAVTFTATGSIGPFQYAVLYDATPTDKPLAGWWNYASSITLAASETFTVQPSSQTTGGTIFTLV